MKNKYLRLLIVAILCLTLAFSAIGITACKKDDNKDGGNNDGGNGGNNNPVPVTYTVTYDSDGGSAVNSQTVNENGKATKPNDPTKTGYDFIAWELNNSAYDFNTAVTGNITLKAKWSIHYYTVKAMLDETRVYDIQYVPYGSKATKVAKDPAMSGKTFGGWMNGSAEYNFDTAVSSDLTLTPSWDNKNYGSVEVTFVSNGGSAVPTQTVTTGAKAQAPEAPTRDDVEFAGWYKDEALTEVFDFENTAVKSNITLYAKWAVKSTDTAVTADTTWSLMSGDTAGTNHFVLTAPVTTETDFNGLKITPSTTGTMNDNGGQSYQLPQGLAFTLFVDKACVVTVSAHGSNDTYSYYTVSHDGVTDTAPQGTGASNTYSVYVSQASKVVIESTNNNCYLTRIKVTYLGDQVSENTTWEFNSSQGANNNEANHYFVAPNTLSAQNDVTTFHGLTIDASGGKLSDNGGTWFQFNNTTAISFSIASDATVKVQGYDNNYTVNGVAASGAAQQLQDFEVSAGKVTIVATANSYIGKIVVEFPETSGAIPDGYEQVDSTCPIDTFADLYGDNVKFSENRTYGNFTIAQNGKVEASKSCINTQGSDVLVTVSGIGTSNSISFEVKNGASGKFTGVTVTNESGTVLDSCGNENKTFTLTNLPAGTYKIASGGGACRIYNLKTSEVLEKGVPVSMTVTPVTVDFLAGATPTAAGVSASVTYANNSIKTKTVLETDVTSVKTDRSGEYIVRVFYTESDETVTATYSVFVYDLKSVALYTSTTSGTTQKTLQTVYTQGAASLSTEGLTVKAVGVLGNKTKEFNMTSSEYTISNVDLSTLGEKTVTVTSKANGNIAASFSIYVVAKAEAESNTVTLSVDPSKPVAGTNFHTVNQALSYLKAANYDATVVKVINIADGEYYEKISIRIPNVQLIGSDTATPNATANNGVVLWYDAISGKTDALGSAYGTNGSASVSVIAADFVARNITFKNYYNTNALYHESKDISSNTQAVALYVDSTSASFYNCKMTGYHDTLYANKGNQYYYKCWIEGRTDFIFGSDAHAYFHQCTINTVSAGGDDGNGGYVVAYQNSTADYGPIFNGCNFTGAETGATDIALGRAWGANFHMVVINSTISGNYSKDPHTTGINKGERYVTMNYDPKPEYMIEANNTGDGAIAETIPNTCTVDETALTTYGIENLSTILGFTPAAE